jgi:two-component system, OmpR family, sensor histidine kinase VicK
MTDQLFPRAMSLAVHELRTPVTVVAGYLRMLLREQGGPLSEKQRKMLEEAERSCARIGALVSEMSEFGKLESGEAALARQDFDLAALLAELATGMHEGHDRDIRVETRGTDRPIMVTGDRARLSTAVRALMHAAVRERADPGIIVVEVTVLPALSPPSAVVAIGDAATVRALADAARDSPHAFDEWRGGLGLALPVGRRVIERQGGALWSAGGKQPLAGSALRLPLRN